MVQFRKSKKFGPFRLTATSRGLSVSGGVPGARISANTRGEVRRTVGIPGSGIYDVKKIKPRRREDGEDADVTYRAVAEQVPLDQMPTADATVEVPASGALLEVPEGVKYLAVVPQSDPDRVTSWWRVAAILLTIALVMVLFVR